MLHLLDTALTSKVFSVSDLTCVRGDRILFKHVGFTLQAGGLLYVLGENGSGKSSLLRLLCGLLMPETGTVFWNGVNVKQSAEIYQENLLYVGHLNGLKDDLTAAENLQMSARIAGNEVSMEQALSALESMDIQRRADLPVRILSQGQKRRVALAGLWLTKRPLWVLDEPFAALDTLSVELLASRLSTHLVEGGMAIITTHQDVAINALSTQTLRLDT